MVRTVFRCSRYVTLLYAFDWSCWVAISSLPPICNLSFNFLNGGVGEQQKGDYDLDVKNILAGSDTKHHWRCS
jgi:hypothetical protein